MEVANVVNLSDEATIILIAFMLIEVAVVGVSSEVIIIWKTVLAGMLIVLIWYPTLLLMTVELVDT